MVFSHPFSDFAGRNKKSHPAVSVNCRDRRTNLSPAVPPKLDATCVLSAYALYIPVFLTELLLRLAYLHLFRLALGSPFALCLYTVIPPPTALCNSFKALLLFVIGLYGYYNAKFLFCQYLLKNFIKFIKRIFLFSQWFYCLLFEVLFLLLFLVSP